jgi:hypothetical protein
MSTAMTEVEVNSVATTLPRQSGPEQKNRKGNYGQQKATDRGSR